jgi:glycosyltransferase involved in cell wall biosynthesis
MSTVEQRPLSPLVAESGELTPLVSVVIPCLDEAESIATCVREASRAIDLAGVVGEVVVVDNGSTDGSELLASEAGARVVTELRRGYGSAYLAGFAEARGSYIVMVDADLTYDFEEIPRFVAELEAGAELVMGDRMDNIRPGAMPWLHRYVGNPILTGLLNLLFRTGVKDAHCGMRAIRRELLPALDLRTTGMEFASEMVLRASKAGLRISQVPIEYRPRSGVSKLSRFRDGWRHVRFLLAHSPTHLFLIPGGAMALIGALTMALVLFHVSVFGRVWDVHAMIAGAMVMVVGSQVLALGMCARAYGAHVLGEHDAWFDRLRRRFRLEHGLVLGGGVTLCGLAAGVAILVTWADRGFGSLSEQRLAVLAATLVIVGIQIFFSSFLLSIIGLRRER